MTTPPLLGWLGDHAAEGREELAQTVRILIHRCDPMLLADLPFDDDETFLDPTLFASFASGNPQPATLRHLLFNRLPDKVAAGVPVRTDGDGKIFIPRLGTLQTSRRGTLELSRVGGTSLSLEHCGSSISYSLKPAAMVGAVEFLAEIPPPFHFLFEEFTEDGSSFTASSFAELGAIALQSLEEALPAYVTCLLQHVRTVIATSFSGINSFSNPASHGAIFLALSRSPSIPEMIEDFVHQAGHVVFTAASLDRSKLIARGGLASMAPYSGNPTDRRTIYESLHGLVTEALMVAALCKCLTLTRWTAREREELQGRLAYISIRAIADFNAFSNLNLLTTVGAQLLDLLSQTIYPLISEHKPMIQCLNLSNQPYTFSYDLFRQANPSHSAMVV